MNRAATIYNREFAFDPNGECEMLRVGSYPHPSGIIQEVDIPALNSMESNFNREKATSPNFPGLLMDFDHGSDDLDKPSEAAGWIQDLRRDGDRLLARVAWTGAGESAARSGRYRLLSPVFLKDEMEALGGKRYRPLRLDKVGLTNAPNMKGLTPISNRREPSQPGKSIAIESLSVAEAAAEFSRIVNRVKAERGCSFEDAWNQCKRTEAALFNRAATASAPQPQSSRKKSSLLLNRYASDALRLLAEENRAAHGCYFDESWRRVCNRHPKLVKLANSQATQTDWEDLAARAFDTWQDNDPDAAGTLLFRGKASARAHANLAFRAARIEHPEFSSRQLWDFMRENHPEEFWLFVVLNAPSIA